MTNQTNTIIHENDNITKKDINRKKKKQKISATLRRLVWNTHIGEDIGKTKCLCCELTDITQLSFTCGHIIAEANNGHTIVSNLKPICQYCNSSMGTQDMDKFIKNLKMGHSDDKDKKREQLCEEAFEKIENYLDYISKEGHIDKDKKYDELRKESFEKVERYLDYMNDDREKEKINLHEHDLFVEAIEMLSIIKWIEYVHNNRLKQKCASQTVSSLNS